MLPNIQRHVLFMRANRLSVGAPPAAWLQQAIADPFVVNRYSPDWTPNNQAHVVTFVMLKEQMTKAQREAGFVTAAGLHLRELLYFKPSTTPPDIFEQQCDGLALRMCQTALKNAASHEEGVTSESAFEAVRQLIRSGDATLGECGSVIDSLFRFAQEPE